MNFTAPTASATAQATEYPQLRAEVEILTINELASLMRCSTRTVRRQIDLGRIPRPFRFGALLRWPRQQIIAWIAQGCPDCRRERRRN